MYHKNPNIPYLHARDWILTKLRTVDDVDKGDTDNEKDFFHIDRDGIFNWNGTKRAYNHTRQKTGNETAGSYSVTESWMIIVGDLAEYGAIDEYTISCNHNHQNGIDTISIEGTITGFQSDNISVIDNNGDYLVDPSTIPTKIYRAKQLLSRLLRNNAFYRRAVPLMEWLAYSRACEIIAQRAGSVSDAIPYINHSHLTEERRRQIIIHRAIKDYGIHAADLNIIPVSKSFRNQTVEGVITYSFEFNNRCSNMFPDTLHESFTTSVAYPNDIFDSVIIPGRQRGPIFFSANTQTAPKYTLNCEMTVQPVALCLRCRRSSSLCSGEWVHRRSLWRLRQA